VDADAGLPERMVEQAALTHRAHGSHNHSRLSA
jgi:hypothetical protein